VLRGVDLTLTYQDGGSTKNAVDGALINIKDDQFVGRLDPSGSGKSSFVDLLSGMRCAT